MHETKRIITQQLRDTCRLTKSYWAAWGEKNGESWIFHYHHGLKKSKVWTLQSFLKEENVTAQIDDIFTSGQPRFCLTEKWETDLGCEKIYFFPNPRIKSVLFVGAENLIKSFRGFFGILANGWPSNSEPEISVDPLLINVHDDWDPGVSLENFRLNDEARKRVRNLDIIHHVVQEVVGMTNISQISQKVAELLVEHFAYEIVLVNLVSEDEKYLVVEGVRSIGPCEVVRGHKIPFETGVDGLDCFDNKGGLISSSLDPLQLKLPDRDEGSEICVDLRDGSFVFGNVVVVGSTKDELIKNDLLVLEALAGVFSSVMIHARGYQQLQMRLRHLQAVRETALDIGADLELNALLERVTLRARELVGAKGAELGLINEENQTVEIQVSKNPWEGYSKGLVLSFDQGVAGHIAVEGKTLVVDDYNSWPGRLQLDKPAPFVAVAGVPLKYKGKVIGTLTISHDDPDKGFDPEDIRLLELLAPQVAVSVRNARLYQELQKIMEAERRAKDHLIRSARLAAVGELAAGVAHELNNPLTTVAGFVEFVLDDLSEDSPYRQDLELVLKEALRAKDVVQRLLDFSRPGDGIRIRTNINDLLWEVAALIQHLAHKRGIELKVDDFENLAWLQIDCDQIKQVLLNLTHNAIQAMPHGGVLLLRTKPEIRKNSDGVTIVIQDNGQGIPPENIGRIFEPFFTTRSPGEGTGLGLSVSYGIVTDHDGIVEVTSTPGVGSIFTIWLPLKSNKVML